MESLACWYGLDELRGGILEEIQATEGLRIPDSSDFSSLLSSKQSDPFSVVAYESSL